MPRFAQRDFSGGLILLPPREYGKPVGLRHNRGVRSPALGKAIRSRWGSRVLATATGATRIHSLFRFEGVRFQGADTGLYAEGTLLSGSQATATPWRNLIGLPVAGGGTTFYCFVATGTALFTIRTPNQIGAWGLSAPSQDFTAKAIPFQNGVNQTTYEDFPSIDPTYWARIENCTLSDVTTTDPPPGGASHVMKAVVASKNTVATVARAVGGGSMDLSRFDLGSGGALKVSSEQDWICLDVKVGTPANLTALDLIFGIQDPTAPGGVSLAATFTYRVVIDDSTVQAQAISPTGIGDIGTFRTDQASIVSTDPTSVPPSSLATRQALQSIAITTIPSTPLTWVTLRIPKASFNPPNPLAALSAASPTGQFGWERVVVVGFSITTNANGGTSVYFANGKVRGGTGMQGDYSYRQTFYDPTSGHRSNPNPNAVSVGDVPRTGVRLTNLPLPIGAEGSQRELWRTVGNGSIWYRLPDRITDPALTTWDDHAADYEGLFVVPPLYALTGAFEVPILTDEELLFDNIRPFASLSDVFGPHLGQIFWTRDRQAGHQGRVYWSPPGRWASMAGFVEVSAANDPMQTGVVWNGQVLVCSFSQWWELQGSGNDWTPRPVFGVPGTRYPFTVVPTPSGIVYLADDGVRIFDGQSSVLLGGETVATIFRGDQADGGLGPFPNPPQGDRFRVRAEVWHDEYFVTDGVIGLSVHLRTQAWRDLGHSFTSMFREPDTDLLTVADGNKVASWEEPGAVIDFSGAAIPFVVETPSLTPNAGQVNALVQRLYVDCNLRNQTVQATVYATDDVIAAGPITLTGADERQTFDIALGAPAGACQVRLEGSLAYIVDVYGIELDGHIPEAPGTGT